MKFLQGFLLFCFVALPAFSQRPQGAGEDLVAITAAGGHLYALREDFVNHDQILRSTDGGISFDVLYTVDATTDELRAIAVHGNVGFAGGGSLLLRAGDLGTAPNTWEAVPSDAFLSIESIAGNGVAAWAVLDSGGTVYQSIDNGDTWTDISPAGFPNLSAIAWAEGQNWIAVGGDTVYAYNGATWDTSVVAAGVMLSAIAVDGLGNVMVAGENGALYFRAADAETFTKIETVDGSSENFTTLLVLGDNDFVVGGDQRGLLRVNGGTASVLLSTQEGPVTVKQITVLDGAVVMAGVGLVDEPVMDATNDPDNPVTVTLTGVNDIYYTTDGAQPETGTLYDAPFTVTGIVTVQAVAESDGVYSPVVSREVIAGEAQQPFALSIAVVSNTLVITQDTSVSSTQYQLQSTTDLTDANAWQDVGTPEAGTGNALQWSIDPIPAGTVSWRSIISP